MRPDRVVNPVALHRIVKSLPIANAINNVVTAVHILRTHAGQFLQAYLEHSYEVEGDMSVNKNAVLVAFSLLRRCPMSGRSPEYRYGLKLTHSQTHAHEKTEGLNLPYLRSATEIGLQLFRRSCPPTSLRWVLTRLSTLPGALSLWT
jgi:hypothetical protein